MIGFKKTPTKLVISVFLISLISILLIYFDFATNNPLPEEEITISKELSTKIPQIKNKQIHEVKKGDSLSVIFEEKNVPLNTAYKIFNFDKNNLLSSIIPGDVMEFNYVGDDLYSIEIIKDEVNSIFINTGNEIFIKKIKKQTQTITSYGYGTIVNSFYKDAKEVGIPDSIIMDFAYIFGWDIDFIFDVRKGDSFFVIFETDYSEGERVSSGDIIFAEFTNKNERYRAQRFYDDIQGKQYFNENGDNVKKAFLRAPLDFAYISSHFNPNRMHPVLHTIRAHNGTDYAAKRGSPVRTTGDGTIKYSGRRNGCGNEIVIQHTNDYSTRYCHLDKFHSGIKKGKKVFQGETIGYVGSTGLATGPHLHYEFKIGNKHIDPVKLKLPSAEPININLKSDFDTLVENNKIMIQKLESLYPNEES